MLAVPEKLEPVSGHELSKRRLSIVMCTYNGERFLREQLDSLLTQTRAPDELVICDDCSTDRTIRIGAGTVRVGGRPLMFGSR